MLTLRAREILNEAAALPTKERAELVDELAQTLPDAYEVDDVDYDELDRRMARVRNGAAELIPWQEARSSGAHGWEARGHGYDVCVLLNAARGSERTSERAALSPRVLLPVMRPPRG